MMGSWGRQGGTTLESSQLDKLVDSVTVVRTLGLVAGNLPQILLPTSPNTTPAQYATIVFHSMESKPYDELSSEDIADHTVVGHALHTQPARTWIPSRDTCDQILASWAF